MARYTGRDHYASRAFANHKEMLDTLNRMYDALDIYGFCPLRLCTDDVDFDTDKWGYAEITRVVVYSNYFVVQNGITCRAFSDPLTALRLDNRVCDVLLAGHCETVRDLMELARDGELTSIVGIGAKYEDAILTALDEYQRDNA